MGRGLGWMTAIGHFPAESVGAATRMQNYELRIANYKNRENADLRNWGDVRCRQRRSFSKITTLSALAVSQRMPTRS